MRTILYLIIVSLFVGSTTLSNNKEKKNEYVNVDINLKQKQLKAGEAAQLFIKFNPKKGIHINAKPEIELKIDNSNAIAKINKPEIPSAGKSDYFDVSKTIKQSITLSKKLKAGTISLKGTLIYYFCSDSEGWCRKFKHPIEMKINIVN